MRDFSLPDLPDSLDGLCEAYIEADGSFALRICHAMLVKYKYAKLSDVAAQNATSFLLLRATILQSQGEVDACRAIYHFAAKQAESQGDLIGQAACLAQLHVDRCLCLDNETGVGQSFVGDIRKDLLETAHLLTRRLLSPNERPLACRTVMHIMHGLALIGAVKDAQSLRNFAQEIAGNDQQLLAELELAQGQVLACQGLIDDALELVEITLGRIVRDPLGLELTGHQFLGTWYQAIGNSQAALIHLNKAKDLCFSNSLESLGLTVAMELVSVLLSEGKDQDALDLASKAMVEAKHLDINNQVIRALDQMMVGTLFSQGKYKEALNCALDAGVRARAKADIDSAVFIYNLAAQCASKLNEQSKSAELYATCAALSSAAITRKASFLRLQAEQLLAILDLTVGQPLPQTSRLHPDLRVSLDLAEELLQEALTLLISVPNSEKEQASVELSAWNRMMAWLRDQQIFLS